MPDHAKETTPTRSFRIVGTLALLWNLIGVATYLASVTMSEAALLALPEAERALYRSIPAWVTSSYAVAVFGGTLASVGLLLRRAWAVPVFILSLLGILLQMGHALLGSALLEVKGPGAAVLPLLIVLIAIYLAWFARAAKRRGLLR